MIFFRPLFDIFLVLVELGKEVSGGGIDLNVIFLELGNMRFVSNETDSEAWSGDIW